MRATELSLLWAELAALVAKADPSEVARLRVVRAQIVKAQRAKAARQARRDVLFTLNGHHGAA
jgi:hypothetical protein